MGLGYYVHIPFCLQKCGYCDFVSYAGKREKMGAYLGALEQEIDGYLPEEVESVFFGGGTPTALAAGQIVSILQKIRERNMIQEDAEISIEVNPETMTQEKAQALLAAGFNRFSIGLQSWEDQVLQAAGRVHSVAGFEKAFGMLRGAGAENINIDLMVGLPKQTYKGFGSTVKRVLDWRPEHVSVYELNLSEESPMAQAVAAGEIVLPPEEEVAAMGWQLEKLEKVYPRYEISNYARPGFACRHNLNYWRNGQYIGAGAGAHGCLAGGFRRYSNPADLERYIANPLEKATDQQVPVEEQMFETVMVGSRLIQGIDLAAFEKRFGKRLPDLLGGYIAEHSSLIENTGSHIRLTKRGLEIQNIVLVEIMGIMEA